MRIFRPANPPGWLEEVLTSIERGLRQGWPRPLVLKTYTVAELPSASDFRGSLVYVSDETGGGIPAFSDGTEWRRVTDRATVS